MVFPNIHMNRKIGLRFSRRKGGRFDHEGFVRLFNSAHARLIALEPRPDSDGSPPSALPFWGRISGQTSTAGLWRPLQFRPQIRCKPPGALGYVLGIKRSDSECAGPVSCCQARGLGRTARKAVLADFQSRSRDA
jgi:hypothetical protein